VYSPKPVESDMRGELIVERVADDFRRLQHDRTQDVRISG